MALLNRLAICPLMRIAMSNSATQFRPMKFEIKILESGSKNRFNKLAEKIFNLYDTCLLKMRMVFGNYPVRLISPLFFKVPMIVNVNHTPDANIDIYPISFIPNPNNAVKRMPPQ